MKLKYITLVSGILGFAGMLLAAIIMKPETNIAPIKEETSIRATQSSQQNQVKDVECKYDEHNDAPKEDPVPSTHKLSASNGATSTDQRPISSDQNDSHATITINGEKGTVNHFVGGVVTIQDNH